MLDQKQGSLILVDQKQENYQKRKFAGHIRPEKGKRDLDQNNVGLITGKLDFVWPKTGKRVGHIRPKKGNMIWTKRMLGRVTKTGEASRAYQTKNKETWFRPKHGSTKNMETWLDQKHLTKNGKTIKNRESFRTY